MKAGQEYNTKQLVIPAKYILMTIAEDVNIMYPIEVSLLTPGGGGYYQVNSMKELKGLCSFRDIYQSSLVRIIKKDDRFYVDLKKNGTITVKRDFMPERHNTETLVRAEVKRFFSLYSNDKN